MAKSRRLHPAFGDQSFRVFLVFLRPIGLGFSGRHALQERGLVERLLLSIDPAPGYCLNDAVVPRHGRPPGSLLEDANPQFARSIMVLLEPFGESMWVVKGRVLHRRYSRVETW